MLNEFFCFRAFKRGAQPCLRPKGSYWYQSVKFEFNEKRLLISQLFHASNFDDKYVLSPKDWSKVNIPVWKALKQESCLKFWNWEKLCHMWLPIQWENTVIFWVHLSFFNQLPKRYSKNLSRCDLNSDLYEGATSFPLVSDCSYRK